MARGSRVPVVLALLALAAVAVPGVFAVQLSLNSDSVARVGGTGEVIVLAPTSNATIDKVTFTVSNTPPYYIQSVNVTLTFAEAVSSIDGTTPVTYTVVVNVYDSLGNLINSAIATGVQVQTDATTGAPVQQTVTVQFPNTVDPRQIDIVEVLVYQETP